MTLALIIGVALIGGLGLAFWLVATAEEVLEEEDGE